ncbi:MAG: DUF3710 domain-containing protein [Mycobacteriaceae bacterium]|uniref:DUF3710 domain-containing protein n=1 Tax=Corynebacterium sp. TaxID=1720 RepID=UPI003F9B23A9
MWPFGRKSGSSDNGEADARGAAAEPVVEQTTPRGTAAPTDAPAPVSGDSAYDPVNGDFGPFDGDSVDYRDFDYSDFAKSGLDLGSVRVPVPHEGEVQVEMGSKGPQMIHILTPFGRMTPVALAAPRSGDLWEESIPEITEGMTNDGLEVTVGRSIWGSEVVGTMKNGTMRVIGVDGPRWVLRVTLAGPADKTEQLSELAYEVISRTFVYRGSDPVPVGQSLPVTIPATMAEELRKVVEQRQKEGKQTGESGTAPGDRQQPKQEQAPQPRQRRRSSTADQQLEDDQ